MNSPAASALLSEIGAAHMVSCRDRYEHTLVCAGEIVASVEVTDNIVADLMALRAQAMRRAMAAIWASTIRAEA